MREEKHNSVEWRPRTSEDRMLEKYWRSRGGTLFLEVPIGGPGGSDAWSDACNVRRIDGVLLPAAARELSVHRFSRRTSELFRESIRPSLELIEVKAVLNRTAIGQAIIARRMFTQQYGVSAKRVTVLCESGDSALEWACKEENIHVEIIYDTPVGRITR
jgi:hypothetical protein